MTISQPFFSVIVPLYNKREEIFRSIESVLNQTYKNFEIIIVNDGSTDGGEMVVEAINDKRIKLIHQKNSGQGLARNTGISHASGDFIAFLDADDSWTRDHLRVIEELILKFPASGAYCTSFAYKKEGINRTYPVIFKNIPDHPWEGLILNYIYVLVNETSPILTNSVCVQKSLLIQLGGFDVQLPLAQDVDLWIRIFLKSSIAYSTNVTSYYHLGTSNQVTRQDDRPVRYFKFIKKLSKYISDDTICTEHQALLKQMQYTFGRNMTQEALMRGDYFTAQMGLTWDVLRYSKFEKLKMRGIMKIIPNRFFKSYYSFIAVMRYTLVGCREIFYRCRTVDW